MALGQASQDQEVPDSTGDVGFGLGAVMASQDFCRGFPVSGVSGVYVSNHAFTQSPGLLCRLLLSFLVRLLCGGRPNRTHFPKEDFHIDLEAGSCTCPAGNVTRTMAPAGRRTGQTGRTYRLQAFRFDAAVCGVCPLRSQCVAAKPGTGRTVQLHPQEALLQQARALQQSEAFAEYRQRRVVMEHRLARLVQLGIRQSRYFGRAKTLS